MASSRQTTLGLDGKTYYVKVGSYFVKNGQTKAEVEIIRDAVTDYGFSQLKFITGPKAQAQACVMLLNLIGHPKLSSKEYDKIPATDENARIAFRRDLKVWIDVHGPAVTYFTNHSRSHAQNQMRLAALRYLEIPANAGKLPPIESILSILNRTIDLSTDANKNLLVWWITDMLPKATANAKLFTNKRHRYEPINKISSINVNTGDEFFEMPASTETFAVVMYDNCLAKWERWHSWRLEANNRGHEPQIIAKRKPNGEDHTPSTQCRTPRRIVYLTDDEAFKTKYSLPDCGQQVFKGWSDEGIKQFETLLKVNKTARSKRAGRAKEREFVQVIKAHFGLVADSWCWNTNGTL